MPDLLALSQRPGKSLMRRLNRKPIIHSFRDTLLLIASHPGRSRTSLGFGPPICFSPPPRHTTPIAIPSSEMIGEPDMPPTIGCADSDIQSGPSLMYSTVH